MVCREQEQHAEKLVTTIFMSPLRQQYPYHNLEHTRNVVAYIKELGNALGLEDEMMTTLAIAGWFHDTDQLYGDMKGHEERSVLIFKNYLQSEAHGLHNVKAIADCIMATQNGATPLTLPEKIIRDADTWHFGTLYFRKTEFLVLEEMKMRTGKTFTHWHQGSMAMLKKHVYHTNYCRQLLNSGKESNIAWLESLIAIEYL